MKNREIRFRIWNGSKMENRIMAGFLGAFYVQGIDEKDSASMSPFNTKYPNETPLMQYTGVLDKTGKEIYEGDIVRCYYGGEAKELIDVIEFKNGGFWLRYRNISIHQYMEYDEVYSSEIEIIGNIHEHKHLLNQYEK